MIAASFKLLVRNTVPRKLIDAVKDIRPSLPHNVGISYYQKASFWKLDKDRCPCNFEFVEYLKRSRTEGKTIFHFGTGGHHIVGLENQEFTVPNEVIGITASAPEYQTYIQFVLKDRALSKYYKVLFVDIYTLAANTLPTFDVVTLFHLCEFYLPDNAPSVHQNDQSLLQLFLDKLKPGGKIVFYTGSWTGKQTQAIVQAFESAGKIKQVEAYKTLLVYAKNE